MEQLEDLMYQYFVRFGEPYLVVPEWQNEQQIAEGIRYCLSTGEPRKKENDSGAVY